MPASTRTPEGEPIRCPICGKGSLVDPSLLTGDAPCPYCGTLFWLPMATSAAHPGTEVGSQLHSILQNRLAGLRAYRAASLWPAQLRAWGVRSGLACVIGFFLIIAFIAFCDDPNRGSIPLIGMSLVGLVFIGSIASLLAIFVGAVASASPLAPRRVETPASIRDHGSLAGRHGGGMANRKALATAVIALIFVDGALAGIWGSVNEHLVGFPRFLVVSSYLAIFVLAVSLAMAHAALSLSQLGRRWRLWWTVMLRYFGFAAICFFAVLAAKWILSPWLGQTAGLIALMIGGAIGVICGSRFLLKRLL